MVVDRFIWGCWCYCSYVVSSGRVRGFVSVHRGIKVVKSIGFVYELLGRLHHWIRCY